MTEKNYFESAVTEYKEPPKLDWKEPLQFEIRKNQYGYMQFYCPFCDKWKPVRNKVMHLSSMARHEGIKKALANEYPTPHLDFYIANTHEVVITRREWNEDFVNSHCNDLLKKW